jgi:hypothetical protein
MKAHNRSSVSTLFLLSIAVSLTGGCAARTVRTETTVARQPGSGSQPVVAGSSSTTIDGRTIASIREEWDTEFISATGTAPVVSKYDDAARNRELARRGAHLDAQRNLAEQVNRIRITSTVTMADLETSDFARSQMNAVLQDIETVSERFDTPNNRWIVELRMPKVKLVRFIEEVSKR